MPNGKEEPPERGTEERGGEDVVEVEELGFPGEVEGG